jgi:RHS repeat-associated protein
MVPGSSIGPDGQTVSVANGYAYRPFGAFYEGECVETVDSPFCFTGQWRDAEIDQYYLRARQYYPVMMRFMTRDPVRGDFAEPMTLHRYLYCWNDPVNLVDLTGESPTSDVLAAVSFRATMGGIFGSLAGFLSGVM